MPKLVWLDQDKVKEQPIPERGFISLGRGADNTVKLSDQLVSRHHAQLVCGPHGCLLKDLKSVNGVQVNGDSVHSRFLKDGDIIRIGRHILEYYTEERLQATGTGGAGSSPLWQNMTASDAGADTLNSQARAFLRFIDGPNTGKIQNVDRPLLPIGNPAQSYAAVSKRTNGYYLLNLGKESLTHLNGQLVSGAGALLQNGDVITLGPDRIEVRIFGQKPH